MKTTESRKGAIILLLTMLSPVLFGQTGFEVYRTYHGTNDLTIIGSGVNQLVNDPGLPDNSSWYHRSNTTFNNTLNFYYLDIDSNSSTFNSTRATFDLPAGSTLVAAILHLGRVRNQ